MLITVGALLVVAWYTSSAFKSFYHDEVRRDLTARARLVEEQVRPLLLNGDSPGMEALCDRLGKAASTRITVILPDGKVMADSENDPALMDDHGRRPEIMAAYRGEIGSSLRFSATLKADLMYVAIPVEIEGRPVAVVRTSIPASAIDAELGYFRTRILVAVGIILVLAALANLLVARRISKPIQRLMRGALRFARGQFDHKIALEDTVELAGLAQAMNKMGAELDSRIKEITAQHSLQQAILSSMSEGVIAVDSEERLISLNRAAMMLLGARQEEAKGRPIHEIVRSGSLRRLITDALASREPVERELLFREAEERQVQGHGTALRDKAGHNIGVLVVLNDITHLRRLEKVRRDFVANVSHELKTPITSIKGFVETLQGSSFEDLDEVRRFLEIIDRHTERLDSIIEDLLSLSRIEQEAESNDLPTETVALENLLKSAISDCEVLAQAHLVSVRLECPPDLNVRVNPPLLEQALVNLIDNAIKYSAEQDEVIVRARTADSQIIIEVIDRGPGIAAEHQPRIFERFYRVDRARSRKLGGTGLGLAIAKHIAIAHRGKISVTSEPGHGSTFSISLPNPA
jgi:two-component system phosphate regulon sensor histidine kinase PhoR